MTNRILIGIGGTGAKIVESYVHLAAAGIGPRRLWVGLVDQDGRNGNLDRTRALIERYRKLRSMLRTSGASNLGESIDLFKPEIDFDAQNNIWRPVEVTDTSRTFGDVFSFESEEDLRGTKRNLFDDPGEIELKLDEGFVQRPTLGAALILDAMNRNAKFWNATKEAIDSIQNAGEPLRVMIAGSIFGGTGAAGFPTIARQIANMARSSQKRSAVKISGVLMLPYFEFPPPPSTDTSTLQPDANEFLLQTQGSLSYYARLLNSNLNGDEADGEDAEVFDSLYLLGWSPLLKLGYHAGGTAKQANPPLVPEFLGALAATRHLGIEKLPEENGSVLVTGRSKNAPFGWDSVPDTSVSSNTIRSKLGQLLRFCVAYGASYDEALRTALGRKSGSSSEHWLRRDGLLSTDEGPGKIILDELAEYAGDFQSWLSDMQHAEVTQSVEANRLDLFDIDYFATRIEYNPNDRDNTAKIRSRLKSAGELRRGGRQFTNIVRGEKGPSFADIFDRMTYRSAPNGSSGMGDPIGSLFKSCAVELGT